MQAVKGVEVGSRPKARRGGAFGVRKVQDTIGYDREQRHFTRGAIAPGPEGGMTNGQDVLVRGMLKPISDAATSARKRGSGDARIGSGGLRTQRCGGGPRGRSHRRGMVALVLAGAMIEKFGGDSLVKRNAITGIFGTGEELLRAAQEDEFIRS